MSGALPPFEELGRGAVLLRGAALAAVVRLADAGERQARYADGLTTMPSWLAEVLGGMRRQVAELEYEVAPIPESDAPAGEVIGAAEAAAMLGLSQRQVTRMAKKLGGVKPGGAWVFDPLAVVTEMAARALDD